MNKIIHNSHRKIPIIDKIGYGSGNFSTGVAIQVMGTYLIFYCTAILEIPGSLVGLAVGLSIIWDAVTDPLMGYASDMTNSKTFGRRHLYVLLGGVGMALSNYFLWNISSGLPAYWKFIIIFLIILIVKSFVTVYVTPYTALGAELSNDYNERTAIQSIKTVFFLLGLAFVSVLGLYVFFKSTPEFPKGQLNPQAYRNMGLFSSLLILVFAVLCFFSTKKYIPILNQHVPRDSDKGKLKNLFSAFIAIFHNKSFIFVALAYMFNNMASALLSNIGLHVFTYTFLLDSKQIAAIIGIQFLVSILSQPIWTLTAEKIDKKPAMLLGIVICIVGSLLFLLLVFMKDYVSGSIIAFLPFAALTGFGIGGLFTLPLSMVADVIDLDELNTGKRAEGSYYGCLTLLYKLSQAVTIASIGFILDLAKFDSGLPVQAKGTVVTLGLVLSIGSGVSFLAAFISLLGYKLNRIKTEEIQKQISQRIT